VVASASWSSASSFRRATVLGVDAGLREIGHEELASLIESDTAVIVDALGPISFGAAHIPTAVNIPPDRVDALARRRIPDPDALVVVYCAGEDCESSVEVARRLVELGYRNVRHYAGGKRDWADAGHEFARARA
jgi:rhodanese-related sulfurtransferase